MKKLIKLFNPFRLFSPRLSDAEGKPIGKPQLKTIYPPEGKKRWYGEHKFNHVIGK